MNWAAGAELATTLVNNTTYSWAGPNGYTSGTASATKRVNTISNASAAATGVYTVTATFNGSCTTTATTEVNINDCNFKIKSINPFTEESQYTLYAKADGTGYEPLVLLAESTDGSPLNNFTFHWTSANGQSFTDPYAQSIQATKGDTYQLRISPVDNSGVGCKFSVQILEYRGKEYLIGDTRNSSLVNGTPITTIPIAEETGFVILNGANYTLHRSSEKKVLEFNYLGEEIKNILEIFPDSSYIEANPIIQPSTFTGFIRIKDFEEINPQVSWRYENGIITEKLPFKYESANGGAGFRQPMELCLEIGYTSCQPLSIKLPFFGEQQSKCPTPPENSNNFGDVKYLDETAKWGDTFTIEGERQVITYVKSIGCCQSTVDCTPVIDDYASFGNPLSPHYQPGGTVSGGTLTPNSSSTPSGAFAGLICNSIAQILSSTVTQVYLNVKNPNALHPEFLSEAKYQILVKLLFEELRSEFPHVANLINDPSDLNIAASFANYSNPENASPGSFINPACHLVQNIIGGNPEDLPLKLGESISNISAAITEPFLALSSLLSKCDDPDELPFACNLATKMEQLNLRYSENIFLSDGQVFMTEEVMNDVFEAFGGDLSNRIAVPITDNSLFGFDQNDNLIYRNGECVVRVWDIKTSGVELIINNKITPKIISRANWGAREPVLEPCGTEEREYQQIALPLAEYYHTLVIHHAGNQDSPTVNSVQNQHIDEKCKADIGYHFAIDLSGNIYEGRPIDRKGAHVKQANTGMIGVLLLADLDDSWGWSNWYDLTYNKFSSKMFHSLYTLIQSLNSKYFLENGVGAHKEINCGHTVCPGNLTETDIEILRIQLNLAKPNCSNYEGTND